LCSADNVWSHHVIRLTITDAYLQLALGKPDHAFNRLEECVQSYRRAGFRFNLAEELWLRGRVQMALSEVESVKEALLEAKAIAEKNQELIYLWQILATLSDVEEMYAVAAETGE
jgi:tetratricopeptide (TPR) repeat protein